MPDKVNARHVSRSGLLQHLPTRPTDTRRNARRQNYPSCEHSVTPFSVPGNLPAQHLVLVPQRPGVPPKISRPVAKIYPSGWWHAFFGCSRCDGSLWCSESRQTLSTNGRRGKGDEAKNNGQFAKHKHTSINLDVQRVPYKIEKTKNLSSSCGKQRGRGSRLVDICRNDYKLFCKMVSEQVGTILPAWKGEHHGSL